MLITKGTIVTAQDVVRADLRIREDKIDEIATSLTPENGEEVLDATDLLVLPGGVDVHTHMDLLVGNRRAVDSFYSGTVAAACGGTTTIIDHMAFGPLGCGLQHQVDQYHKLADGQAVIDYGFHGVVDHVDEAILAQMATIAREGITSFKFYLTYDRRLSTSEIAALLARAHELGVLICVHCEDHTMLADLREQFLAEGKGSPRYHPLSRPPEAEAKAIEELLSLARKAGEAPVYVVHTSSAAGLAAASVAGKATDQSSSAASTLIQANAFLETCPVYLVLDDGLYSLPGDEGLKYIMSPPLRKAADREALWAGLADGRISIIATDHCPWNYHKEKQEGRDDFSKCPNGVGSVELRLSLVHSEGVVKRGMDIRRFVDLCCTTPARRFGLYPRKGTLAPGSDADIVLFDPRRQFTATYALLHENVDYTPFEGLRLCGCPVATLSRGEIIARDGAFIGKKGRGTYLRRSLPDLK